MNPYEMDQFEKSAKGLLVPHKKIYQPMPLEHPINVPNIRGAVSRLYLHPHLVDWMDNRVIGYLNLGENYMAVFPRPDERDPWKDVHKMPLINDETLAQYYTKQGYVCITEMTPDEFEDGVRNIVTKEGDPTNMIRLRALAGVWE